MRLRLVPALGAIAGVLLALTVATPVSAAPSAAAVDYVALGDSYASGVGTNNYDSSSGSCRRSPQSYAPRWASSHAVASFQFAACSGATTRNVLSSQLGGLNTGTDLVSISIGGNDAGFADVVTSCVLGSDSSCASAVNTATAYITNTLPARLDETYRAIRDRAPSAQVVVLGYPRLFEAGGSCGLLGMSAYKRQLLNNGSDLLSGVIAGRVSAAGFTYADVRSRFAGHGVCGSSPWVNSTTWPIVESYHPNASGYGSGYLPALVAVTG